MNGQTELTPNTNNVGVQKRAWQNINTDESTNYYQEILYIHLITFTY